MLMLMREGSMPDWKKFKDKPNSKIYYKHEDGFNQLTLYIEEVLEAPMLNLFAVLGEAQLFKNWIPMMKQSDMVAEVSYLRKLAYFRVKLPWPFE
jgi:hypothetical protein